ncbi:adenylate kinase [Candidatus Micrarchaeota archaeon]|nr:adenylate kinase [Candidatus Micrarchaeota archaeon]
MIIVMGLPGAGKTTVLNKAKGDYKVLNYGTLMFEEASKKGFVSNRDELRKLDVSKQREIQALVAVRLSNEEGRLILDTHCSVRTPRGYLPGLPISLLKNLKVDALVLISASINDIMQRRESDTSRVRDAESRGLLEEHDLINKAFLASYSAFTGSPAKIIMNNNGALEKAVKELSSILM